MTGRLKDTWTSRSQFVNKGLEDLMVNKERIYIKGLQGKLKPEKTGTVYLEGANESYQKTLNTQAIREHSC